MKLSRARQPNGNILERFFGSRNTFTNPAHPPDEGRLGTDLSSLDLRVSKVNESSACETYFSSDDEMRKAIKLLGSKILRTAQADHTLSKSRFL